MKRFLPVFALLLFTLSCAHRDPHPDPAPQPVVPTPDNPPHTPYTVIQNDGKTYHTGLVHRPDEHRELGRAYLSLTDCGELPAEFDLRTLGVVPPIRDQGQCGSCWSFSETGSLESALLGAGKTLNLAEQELVSCDSANYGCNGGNISDYQIKHGEGLESDFPYKASDVRCKSITPAAKGMSWVYVGASNRAATQKEIMCALYTSHTVPWITVSASNAWGSPPSSELTPYTRCGSGQTNHAVGVVGWHTINGKVYLIMKNSWGTSWGDKGYMSMQAGCDSFGDEVAYLTVDAPNPPPPPPPTPTPDPCVPPVVRLPRIVEIMAGEKAHLGVDANPQYSYEWFDGAVSIGRTSMIDVSPSVDTVYKLVVSASCGRAESSVKVVLIPAAKR